MSWDDIWLFRGIYCTETKVTSAGKTIAICFGEGIGHISNIFGDGWAEDRTVNWRKWSSVSTIHSLSKNIGLVDCSYSFSACLSSFLNLLSSKHSIASKKPVASKTPLTNYAQLALKSSNVSSKSFAKRNNFVSLIFDVHGRSWDVILVFAAKLLLTVRIRHKFRGLSAEKHSYTAKGQEWTAQEPFFVLFWSKTNISARPSFSSLTTPNRRQMVSCRTSTSTWHSYLWFRNVFSRRLNRVVEIHRSMLVFNTRNSAVQWVWKISTGIKRETNWFRRQ